MKPIFKTTLSLIAFVMIASPALAQSNRFTMTPSDDGFLRLDTQTGAVSICNKSSGQWNCKSLSQAGDDDVGSRMTKLIKENKELKAEIDKLETELFKVSKNRGSAPNKELQLPTEQDVDKVMGFMERLIDRFRSLGKKLKEEDKNFGTPL